MRRELNSITLILLVLFALLTIRLDSAWVGHQDGNGTWISAGARSYELYGAKTIGYLQIINRGPATPDTYDYYVNHPPLMVWAVTVFGQWFGQRADGAPLELSARLMSIFSTMIGLAAFYVLARRLFHKQKIAQITLMLYAFTPMIAYFGRMPDHEPPALMFLFIFAAVMVNWLKRPTWPRWGLMFVCAALAVWTAWASVFMLAGLGLAALWLGDKRTRRDMVLLGASTFAALIAIPLFYESQKSGAIDLLIEAFTYRTSNQSASRGSDSFTLIEFVVRFVAQSLPLMSIAVLTFGAAGLWRVVQRGERPQKALMGAFIVGTFGYMLTFRNAFHIHDYYKIYFLPGLALATSFFLFIPRKKHNLLRPVSAGLFALSALMSVIFFALIHIAASHNDSLPRIAEALKANSQADSIIVSNTVYRDGTMDFYAFRNITWDIPPDEATGADIYLYCLDETTLEFADIFPDTAYISVEDCRIYPLEGAGS